MSGESELDVLCRTEMPAEALDDDDESDLWERTGGGEGEGGPRGPFPRAARANAAEEATKAVTEMHLKTVQGKPLYVGLAEKKDQRIARLSARYNKGAGKGKAAGRPTVN